MDSSMYRIKLEGRLDPGWREWFDGWEMTADDDGATLLTGRVSDQSELHGILAKIRDLNLTLVFIHRIGEQSRTAREEKGKWLWNEG